VGVRTADGVTHPADAVVAATGTRLHPGTGSAHLVRPVRGEIVRARLPEVLAPPRTVRASVHGTAVYVVPRAGGEVVIGATTEEHAGVPVATVGGVSRLLDAARTLLPHLDRAELVEVLARDRPGTPDNGPLIGPSPVPGLHLAAGHHRGGVLLAPVTARAVRSHVEGGAVPSAAVPFHPGRFEEGRSGPSRSEPSRSEPSRFEERT
jgi:glycine oxidase